MAVNSQLRTLINSAITAIEAIKAGDDITAPTTAAYPVDVWVGMMIWVLDGLAAYDFGEVRNELLAAAEPTDIAWNGGTARGYTHTVIAALN